MAEIARSNRNAASPWTAGAALQRALKTMPSELLQSSSSSTLVGRGPCCGGDRDLIPNAISKLNPEMLYRQIQYLVEEGDWASQGEEVSVGAQVR